MELEELKSRWEALSQQVEKQQHLNDKILMEITQQKYSSKFQKLMSYEIVGALVCIAAVILISVNLHKMNTWYLMACSLFSLTFLTVLPILVITNLVGLKNINLANGSYKATLIYFQKRKKRLLLVQQMGVLLSVVLMFTTMPVFSMIFNNKDFFLKEYSIGFWVFITIVAIAVLLFSLWGYRCYKRTIGNAEALLKDIE